MSDAPRETNISLRQVAQSAGVSVATVSRALRNDPNVKEKTRKKVELVAQNMGYRPNPMVKSLMAAQKRRRSAGELRANICWLNGHPMKDFWHSFTNIKHMIEAARDRAHDLGYGFEEIWEREPGMSDKRFRSIAYARYVQGILVPGTLSTLAPGAINWDDYAVVCIRDRSAGQLEWNRCSASSRRNVEIAYEHLYDLGYRRIAFCGSDVIRDAEMARELKKFNAGKAEARGLVLRGGMKAQVAGFMSSQAYVHKDDHVWPFLFDGSPHGDLSPLVTWLRRVRPEAVITNGSRTMDACQLARLRVPKDIALAHINIDDDVEGWAGIKSSASQEGRAAVDMLCAQIERNERGVPEFPIHSHIVGDWTDGWTAPSIT